MYNSEIRRRILNIAFTCDIQQKLTSARWLSNDHRNNLPTNNHQQDVMMELIKWIHLVHYNRLDLLTIRNVNNQLAMVRMEVDNHYIIDHIHGCLMEAVTLRRNKSHLRIDIPCIQPESDGISPTINGLINSLIDNPIIPPKIPFSHPRIVKTLWKNDISKRMRRRAKAGELDLIRYPRWPIIIMIEPSMQPLTLRLRDRLNYVQIEKMNKVVNDYRLALAMYM